MVEMNSSPPRTEQQRSQPAVYQLHQVQDLRFLNLLLRCHIAHIVAPMASKVGFSKMCALHKWRLFFRCRKCVQLHVSVVNATTLIHRIRVVLKHFIWEVGCGVHPLNLGWVNFVSLIYARYYRAYAYLHHLHWRFHGPCALLVRWLVGFCPHYRHIDFRCVMNGTHEVSDVVCFIEQVFDREVRCTSLQQWQVLVIWVCSFESKLSWFLGNEIVRIRPLFQINFGVRSLRLHYFFMHLAWAAWMTTLLWSSSIKASFSFFMVSMIQLCHWPNQRLLKGVHPFMDESHCIIHEVYTVVDRFVAHVNELFPFFEESEVLVIQVANL